MFTVLLVDDEKAELNTLEAEVDWPQFGINTVLTATDAGTAKALMERERVDLLITDINMPYQDGLSLVAHVREHYPDVRCILLTAYSQFDYARQAIKLGVENYLLKPINHAELDETLNRAIDNLYIHRQNMGNVFKENLLERWLTGAIDENELSERSAFLRINLYLPRYRVILSRKRSAEAISARFCMALKERLASSIETYLIWEHCRSGYSLILGGHNLDDKLLVDIIYEIAEDYPETAQLSLSLGRIVFSSAELSVSYQSAMSKLNSANSDNVKLTVLTQETRRVMDPNAVVGHLSSIMNMSDNAERQEAIENKLNFAVANGASYDDVYRLLTDSILRLFDQSFQMPIEQRELLINRLHLAVQLSDKEQFLAYSMEILDYSYLLYHHALNEMSPIVYIAIQYVQNNYADYISIKDFCSKNKISTPYFGHLFKTQTGVFFNNYVTQYRICRAIGLIQEQDLRIDDIARETGFASVSYFISCFKKQTGLSPTKYRFKREY